MLNIFKKDLDIIFGYPEHSIHTIGMGVPVAIIVGHNSKRQGAVNYKGESEFSFNSRIAEAVQTKLTEMRVSSIVIKRPPTFFSDEVKEVVKECVDKGIEFTVHLHFNSAEVKAKGCEVLIAPTASNIDDTYARYIAGTLKSKYGFNLRGDRGVETVQKGHRGYEMLKSLSDTGIVPLLIEPCFANYRHIESEQIFEDEPKYIATLVEIIYTIARGEVPSGYQE